tara:strand:+ start:114 stop:338 length:225 start_codon:yes stop_codon:yes gene_type:complete
MSGFFPNSILDKWGKGDKKNEIGYEDFDDNFEEEEWVSCPFDLDSKSYDDIDVHYGHNTVSYRIITNDDFKINY